MGSMERTVTCNVADISPPDRQSLEGILGGPLAANQQVLIVAYTPGVEPDEATRNQALDEINAMIAAADARAKALGISAEEADAAVEEAMREIRRRPQ